MEVGGPVDSVQLTGLMDRATARMAAASAEMLAAIATFDRARLWVGDGATSMTPWLCARYALTWGTAREWVRVARALRRLPRIAEAYAKGLLSWDQLRPLTRFATAEMDDEWAGRAPAMGPAALYREAERHMEVRPKDADDLYRRRHLSFHWDEEIRALYLEGMLPPEQGAALQAAVERQAERVVLADQPDMPAEARLADALVELTTGSIGEQPAPPTLVVHASADVLTHEEPPEPPWLAETESGRRLTSEAVRRLACDARIDWILESHGRPVGIGRRGRTIPGAIGRLLRHRDGGCRFPGCARKQWLNAHHLTHWGRGGGTDLDNLILLCHAHHGLLHEGGWRTSGHPAHDLRFHDPGGRPVRSMGDSKAVGRSPPARANLAS